MQYITFLFDPATYEPVLEFVRQHKEKAPYIVLVLAFLECLAIVSLIVPATAILVSISGILGVSGVSLSHSIYAAIVGAFMGYAVSYWVGLFFKKEVTTVWPFRDRPEMFEKGEAFFQKWGALAVFLGHFFGPVRGVVPILAGVYGMRQWVFQFVNAPAAVVWAVGVMVPGIFTSGQFWEVLKKVF